MRELEDGSGEERADEPEAAMPIPVATRKWMRRMAIHSVGGVGEERRGLR